MTLQHLKLAVAVAVASLVLASGSYAEKKDKPDKSKAESSMKEKDRPGPPGPDRSWRDREGQGGLGFRGFGGPGFQGDLFSHPEVQKKLDLTKEQVEALKKNRSELEKRRIKLDADLEIARMEMMELLKGTELDKAAIDKQVEVLGDLHKQQVRGMIDHIVAAHEVLDASQLEKVRGFVHRMHERFGEGGPPARGEVEDRFRRFREERGRGPQGPPHGDRGQQRGRRFGDVGEGPGAPGAFPGENPPLGPGERFTEGRPPLGPPPGGFPPADPNSFQPPRGPGFHEDFADLGPGFGRGPGPGPRPQPGR